MKPTEKIWHNGQLINWQDATIHVLSHVVSYGSAVFEGVRCYETKNGPAVFRLNEHVRRLFDSAKVYRMDMSKFTQEQVASAMVELVQVNKMKSCYFRPIVLRGYGVIGVNGTGNPTECYIACWEWGKYLGPEAMEQGVDVCVSSWNRMAPNTLPALAKSAGNYNNSQLINMEAKENGYSEGIALDVNGLISEGSGENIFAVRDGIVYTPSLATSVLPGITRDSVVKIAKSLGYQVIETGIPREFLYVADEVFFTGTAAEVTPIRSIDRITIGAGRRGPITEKIQSKFFGIVNGSLPDEFGWLTPVPQPIAV
ncbi:branched-chain amino acid transaminase [Bryobacter aggregatus]|uniref:branched-chain amino acid transaminase n=1 Tax=Bryobacter aggregatus TaxID=360054 RepID=UPI0004E1CEFD|nr:branched-chain amino acid transaminase [Bryobacter aggregatus]